MVTLIKPLVPGLLDDFLHFFDTIVFTENPHWPVCYCYSFYFTGPPEEWSPENNRSAVIWLISQGYMKGYFSCEKNGFRTEKP
jgi:hypothetical protein